MENKPANGALDWNALQRENEQRQIARQQERAKADPIFATYLQGALGMRAQCQQEIYKKLFELSQGAQFSDCQKEMIAAVNAMMDAIGKIIPFSPPPHRLPTWEDIETLRQEVRPMEQKQQKPLKPQFVRAVVVHVYMSEDGYCGHQLHGWGVDGKEYEGNFIPSHDREDLVQTYLHLAKLEGWTLDLEHSEFKADHESEI